MINRVGALLSLTIGGVLGLTVATQATAAALGYHKVLGQPVALWYGYPIYPFWQYALWYLYWGQTTTAWGAVVHAKLLYLLSGCALGMCGALACRWRGMKAPNVANTLHGSARWAAKREVRNAGLFAAGNSVILGKAYGRYLRHNGEAHTIVLAPTGGGKTVGVIIPSLLSVTSSVVVFDLKGELWEQTAGFRSQYGPCFYINPCAPDGARYNPLTAIRQGLYETQDVQALVQVLTNTGGNQHDESSAAEFWQAQTRAFLTGIILHVLYAEEDKTLRGLVRFLSHPERTLEDALDIMRTTRHLPTGAHPLVAEVARDMLNASANTRAGVNQGVLSHLTLYRDPLLERVTSANDFTLEALQHGSDPMSIYLVVPPGDLLRLKPWTRLMLQQVTQALTRDDTTGPRSPVDLILDEFPAIGPMPFFTTRLAYLRSYRVRALLAVQSLNQLDEVHGRNNSILDLCGMRVLMGSYDERTAWRMSELAGQSTVSHTQESHGKQQGSWWKTRTQSTDILSPRRLVTPDEILRLAADESIILANTLQPIRATNVRHFVERPFLQRVFQAPPHPPAHVEMPENPWLAEGRKPRALPRRDEDKSSVPVTRDYDRERER